MIARGTFDHRLRRLGFYYGSMEDNLHITHHVQLRHMQQMSDALNFSMLQTVAGAVEESEGARLAVTQTRSVVRRHELSMTSVRLHRTYEEEQLERAD